MFALAGHSVAQSRRRSFNSFVETRGLASAAEAIELTQALHQESDESSDGGTQDRDQEFEWHATDGTSRDGRPPQPPTGLADDGKRAASDRTIPDRVVDVGSILTPLRRLKIDPPGALAEASGWFLTLA